MSKGKTRLRKKASAVQKPVTGAQGHKERPVGLQDKPLPRRKEIENNVDERNGRSDSSVKPTNLLNCALLNKTLVSVIGVTIYVPA